MAWFQTLPQNDFASLFRLLDDYDDHRATRSPIAAKLRGHTHLRSFAPRFDIHEDEEAYYLNGELPGVENKSDIQIDFVDAQTLTVAGRVERKYTSEPDASAPVEDAADTSADSKKATVEDTPEEGDKAVADTGDKTVDQPKEAPKPKFWATERAIGEFHRTFSFPTNVDQDSVKATLNNGILSIVVPKAQAPKAKRITVE